MCEMRLITRQHGTAYQECIHALLCILAKMQTLLCHSQEVMCIRGSQSSKHHPIKNHMDINLAFSEGNRPRPAASNDYCLTITVYLSYNIIHVQSLLLRIHVQVSATIPLTLIFGPLFSSLVTQPSHTQYPCETPPLFQIMVGDRSLMFLAVSKYSRNCTTTLISGHDEACTNGDRKLIRPLQMIL